MIKELRHFENLGTPKFFFDMFSCLSQSKGTWTKKNLNDYFYNKVVDGRFVFDGCLPLAELIGAINVDNKGFVGLNPTLSSSLTNDRLLMNKLLKMILVAIKNDEIFYEIFCPENISYDIVYHIIQIDNSAFHFRYANLRQLLVSFDFLQLHPDRNIRKFIINARYKEIFEKEFITEIKRRKVGLAELEKKLELKQSYGREAENFVLEFELKRLIDHPKINEIEIISEFDVSAGYDIISFETYSSTVVDRFIEVKSYSGIPKFYWSRNEIDVARIKKDKYFLYLVDREKAIDTSYIPYIIQDPYQKIIKDDSGWGKRVEKYFVSKNN